MGYDVDWIIKTSEPLTLSLMEQLISPSLKTPISALPKGSPRSFAMAEAKGLFEEQEKILMSLP